MSHRDILGLFSRSSTIEAQYAAVRERLLGAISRWQSIDACEVGGPDDAFGVSDYFTNLEQTVISQAASLSSPLCKGHMTGAVPHFEKADSVVVDGHKQMYLPVGVSALLLRDPKCARVIEKQSRYMLQEGAGDLGRRALEGSRNGASLYFHAALQLIGTEGYAFLMEANLKHAKTMADLIAARPEFELLVAPETNIVLFRGLPARCRYPRGQRFSVEATAALNIFNERLQKKQSEAGRTFVSRTTIEVPARAPGAPLVALRAVISHPLLEESHMSIVLDDLASIMADLDERHDTQTRASFDVFAETGSSAAAEVLQSDGGYAGNGGV